MDDLDAVIERLEREVAEEEQKGTNDARLTELRSQLEGVKAAVAAQAQGGTAAATATVTMPAAEAERLRQLEQQAEVDRKAAAIADAVHSRIQQDEAATAAAIATKAQELLVARLGGTSVDEAVKRALQESRGGSRFVGNNATPDLVDLVAKGGSYQVQDTSRGLADVQVGDHRGVKALEESQHKWGEFIVALYRQKAGLPMTEAQTLYLRGMHEKALAEGTPSAGGYLIRPEWMADILQLLRARAVVRRANPRIQPFNRLMNQTSVSTSATAYYTLENAAITPSEPSLAEVPLLTPKNLTALVAASNYLLNDAASAEQWVRDDMVEVIQLREDLAFLRGDGTGGEPVGLRNKAGITLDPLVPPGAGFLPTLAQLRRIRAVFRAQNAGNVRPAWFFGVNFLTFLETMEEMSGGSPTGRLLLDANILRMNDDGASGVIDGVPFFTTTQWPENITYGGTANTTELMLVNMAECIVGESQELEVDVSTQATYTPDGGTTYVSAFQNNQSVFRGIMRHDIAHRRPQQIVVQRGIKTQ